jgi:hypothetical protein
MLLSLSDLMGAARGTVDQKTHRDIPEAQVVELRARLAQFNKAVPTFKRGDIIQHKEGLEWPMIDSRTSHVWMFWRYLNMENPVDRMNAETAISKAPGDRFDCLVAHVTSKDHVCWHVAYSQTIELREIDTSAYEQADHNPINEFLRIDAPLAPEKPIPA